MMMFVCECEKNREREGHGEKEREIKRVEERDKTNRRQKRETQ
jgi:hypothetical protein